MGEKLRLGVLLSGSGTTLENLLERVERGELPAQVVVVVSSRRDAYGLVRARKRNIPTSVYPRKKFRDIGSFSGAIFGALRKQRVELVCLAGFMVQLQVPPDFQGRVMNVHPALLPAWGGKGFYGHFVHEAVLKAGVKTTGATVHFVDNDYDHGPVILQKPVEVLPGDTQDSLAARVQAAEREIYPEAIRLFAEGRLRVEGNRVVMTNAQPG